MIKELSRRVPLFWHPVRHLADEVEEQSPSKRVAAISNETSGTSNESFKVPSVLKYSHEVSDLCKSSRGGGPRIVTTDAR
jgi:hypothetical protein